MAKIIKKITGLKPNQNYLVSLKSKNTELSAIDNPYPTIRFLTPTDATIPGAIDNNTFFIYGNYKSVMFTFEPTTDLDVEKYKYELYSDSAGATLISYGFATASVFTVDVANNSQATDDSSAQTNVKYYGRIKTVDTSGNESAWTPSSGLKESSETSLIESSHIRNLTASKITAGTINAHEIILKQQGAQTSISAPANMAILRSSNYNGSYNNGSTTWTAGSTGWVIGGDGYAEFSSASIRGALKAGSVFIDANNRWRRDSSDSSSSSDFKVGSASKYMYFDGTNLTFTGNLSAAGGTFSGSLSAATGTFQGRLQAGDIYVPNTASPKFKVDTNGNMTCVDAQIDGTLNGVDGTFNGNISGASGTFSGSLSASSGTIGGWNITGIDLNSNNGNFLMNSVTGDANLNSVVMRSDVRIDGDIDNEARSALYYDTANVQSFSGFQAVFSGGSGSIRLGIEAGSSRKFKDILGEPTESFDPRNLLNVPVVTFKYKQGHLGEEEENKDKIICGLIAEDLEEHYPSVVHYLNGEIRGYNYVGIVPPMLKLIQDLYTKIDQLENRISELE